MSRLIYYLGLKSLDYTTLLYLSEVGWGHSLSSLDTSMSLILWKQNTVWWEGINFLCYWPTGIPEVKSVTCFCLCTASTKLYVHHTRKMTTQDEVYGSHRDPENYRAGLGDTHLPRMLTQEDYQSSERNKRRSEQCYLNYPPSKHKLHTGVMPLFRKPFWFSKGTTPSYAGVLSFLPYHVLADTKVNPVWHGDKQNQR